jgi:hypothetical protein
MRDRTGFVVVFALAQWSELPLYIYSLGNWSETAWGSDDCRYIGITQKFKLIGITLCPPNTGMGLFIIKNRNRVVVSSYALNPRGGFLAIPRKPHVTMGDSGTVVVFFGTISMYNEFYIVNAL